MMTRKYDVFRYSQVEYFKVIALCLLLPHLLATSWTQKNKAYFHYLHLKKLWHHQVHSGSNINCRTFQPAQLYGVTKFGNLLLVCSIRNYIIAIKSAYLAHLMVIASIQVVSISAYHVVIFTDLEFSIIKSVSIGVMSTVLRNGGLAATMCAAINDILLPINCSEKWASMLVYNMIINLRMILGVI